MYALQLLDWLRLPLFKFRWTLKKGRQFDDFVVTGGTVIVMATYSATSDNKAVKLTTPCFQWSLFLKILFS